jgi:hypothetical protein
MENVDADKSSNQQILQALLAIQKDINAMELPSTMYDEQQIIMDEIKAKHLVGDKRALWTNSESDGLKTLKEQITLQFNQNSEVLSQKDLHMLEKSTKMGKGVLRKCIYGVETLAYAAVLWDVAIILYPHKENDMETDVIELVHILYAPNQEKQAPKFKSIKESLGEMRSQAPDESGFDDFLASLDDADE